MEKNRQLSPLIFITGTDTGAGKTVLTGLLLAHLRRRGIHALAMKPFLSGSWDDANLLRQLQEKELSLAEISPFFFPEPVAPLISARIHKKHVSLAAAVESIQSLRERCEILLVEGIGGLRVPLDENYGVAELIAALKPAVLVAAANRLGVINQAILTCKYLQSNVIPEYTVALMGQMDKPPLIEANAKILREWLAPNPVFEVPYLGENASICGALQVCEKKFHKIVARCLRSCRVIPVAALQAKQRRPRQQIFKKDFDTVRVGGRVRE
jgi:dethiobiotin synthetase